MAIFSNSFEQFFKQKSQGDFLDTVYRVFTGNVKYCETSLNYQSLTMVLKFSLTKFSKRTKNGDTLSVSDNDKEGQLCGGS